MASRPPRNGSLVDASDEALDTLRVGAGSEIGAADPSGSGVGRMQQISAALLLGVPLLGVIYAIVVLWGHGIGWFDLGLGIAMYMITGHGLSVGFHRMLSHGSFRPSRWLKITLAVLGSMGVEGSLFTWVAQHRRHHAYADRPGDPHSPWEYGSGFWAQLRGLGHAHFGWMFLSNPSQPERWIPDLLADRDLAAISRTATVWAVLSLAFPFLLGLAVTRTISGALLALLWGGLVRMALLHHVTWGVNSIGHMFGRRPFRTRDRSVNVLPLALLSFGDSWHNAHHAFPLSARHGVDRAQIDSSAGLIRLFERFGWATHVNWPTAQSTSVRRLQ